MNQSDFFKCLSDPTRLDILKLILARHNVCVCELTEHLQLSQPKISRHLALLRNLSILLDQRQGQWVYYRLNPNLPEWAKDILNILSNLSDHSINLANSQSSIPTHCE
ncbi:ArsR/SmtB family transcription factor [Acinetobacter soli]|uniref:ArsR/SmtB family transcription factor n=1 Tax=Acinetobacter soli TaxID=487316 RepID=UPI00258F57A7|nr:metalloregulator ArsR/SmtB family transcription factor [uncultured Acinetobacter sp.]